MSRSATAILGCALLIAAASAAQAQVKIIPGERQTTTATIEGIESGSRMLTVRTDKGELHTFRVPESQTGFSSLKIGDKISATYYDNVVVRKKAPGEADVDTREGALIRGSAGGPGSTAAIQQTITATIDAIDPNVPSITLSGPRGWKYSTKVQDKKALEQVKVGDKVDITWTEAMLVSVAKK